MADELIIGMMSGTSVDGIDAALVSFQSASSLSVEATDFTRFPVEIKKRIDAVALGTGELAIDECNALDQELAGLYARAAVNLLDLAGRKREDITAIANHGQTVRHQPNATPPFSLQLGDPQRIADLSGITTISRFRQADLEAGGQGAPLMPAFHDAVFSRPNHRTAILNLGGIANITLLDRPVTGYDTGPGNTLMDQWIWQSRREAYDRDGEWAATGSANLDVLESLLADPYFEQPAPKSTGTDYFNLAWLQSHLQQFDDLDPFDLQATLLALTVESVALELESVGGARPLDSLYVCGGGANNALMMTRLQERLPSIEVSRTDALGVGADWVEAAGFAWLGHCYLHDIPGNMPSVTGASKSVLLGEKFTPRSA